MPVLRSNGCCVVSCRAGEERDEAREEPRQESALLRAPEARSRALRQEEAADEGGLEKLPGQVVSDAAELAQWPELRMEGYTQLCTRANLLDQASQRYSGIVIIDTQCVKRHLLHDWQRQQVEEENARNENEMRWMIWRYFFVSTRRSAWSGLTRRWNKCSSVRCEEWW